MSSIRRLLSPLKASTFSIRIPSPPFSIFRNPFCGRSGLFKILPKHVNPESETHVLAFGRILQKKALHISKGQKLFVGSFLGFSVATGLIYQQTNEIYAMDDKYAEMEEPSGFLKDDLHALWSLARKFQLPVVLLVTVLLGWRHPFALAINVALLLFCTRPNPFSIYMFVEQLRQRDMRRDPSLQKTKVPIHHTSSEVAVMISKVIVWKSESVRSSEAQIMTSTFMYVKKVEVEDYKILCMARVELRDMKMDVIGILGGWWVFQTSPADNRS